MNKHVVPTVVPVSKLTLLCDKHSVTDKKLRPRVIRQYHTVTWHTSVVATRLTVACEITGLSITVASCVFIINVN